MSYDTVGLCRSDTCVACDIYRALNGGITKTQAAQMAAKLKQLEQEMKRKMSERAIPEQKNKWYWAEQDRWYSTKDGPDYSLPYPYRRRICSKNGCFERHYGLNFCRLHYAAAIRAKRDTVQDKKLKKANQEKVPKSYKHHGCGGVLRPILRTPGRYRCDTCSLEGEVTQSVKSVKT